MALAGDTAQCDDFSFLNKKKFRSKKLAENFEVIVRWEDGTEIEHNLQEDPDPNKQESVKYIPQTYLETVCTETSVDEGSAFQHELRKVIFSHITDPNNPAGFRDDATADEVVGGGVVLKPYRAVLVGPNEEMPHRHLDHVRAIEHLIDMLRADVLLFRASLFR